MRHHTRRYQNTITINADEHDSVQVNRENRICLSNLNAVNALLVLVWEVNNPINQAKTEIQFLQIMNCVFVFILIFECRMGNTFFVAQINFGFVKWVLWWGLTFRFQKKKNYWTLQFNEWIYYYKKWIKLEMIMWLINSTLKICDLWNLNFPEFFYFTCEN